jgi:hypothetical protein
LPISQALEPFGIFIGLPDFKHSLEYLMGYKKARKISGSPKEPLNVGLRANELFGVRGFFAPLEATAVRESLLRNGYEHESACRSCPAIGS